MVECLLRRESLLLDAAMDDDNLLTIIEGIDKMDETTVKQRQFIRNKCLYLGKVMKLPYRR